MRDPSYVGRYRYGAEAAAILPALAEGAGGAGAASSVGAGVMPAMEAGGMQGAAALGGGAPSTAKGGASMLGGLNSGKTGDAAMQLMKMANASKVATPSAPTTLPRSASATQPSIQNFIKMLQQRNGPTMRMPGMGG